MIALLLLTQTGGGGQAQQIAATFGVDWPHFLAQLVSFTIVCALLYRFAYKRVLAMLEQRRQEIAESLANAEKIKAELLRTEAERQRVIDEANAQALRLIEEARVAAARVGRDETQKALAAAEQILLRAREASAQDHARMLAELKREVGRLVVQTTAAVAGRVLTPEDQRNLNEQTARLLS
ncbi:MAG TPA: ATP synthase F0 subunit B [Vicinamibacteria bacterium]|nr:ATP synthase F0 subunit B [Vicinamibacteria bacterium]